MNKIKKFLTVGFEGNVKEPNSLIKYYWEASLKANELITMVFGDEGSLPIDVEMLAEVLGVDIIFEDLNEFSIGKSMNKKIGQIRLGKTFFRSDKINTIYIDMKAPPSSQRYAIAHELTHYIMHYDDSDDYYEDYCIMPMCPKDIEEIIADIFATFLLIPVRYFFEEFLYYVKRMVYEMGKPISTEKWIQYLAERSMVSEYYVAYGYQQLRYVAYWIYQAWNGDDANKEMTKEEREKIKSETVSYYTEEMGRMLFQ